MLRLSALVSVIVFIGLFIFKGTSAITTPSVKASLPVHPGFPVQTTGWIVFSSPVVADINQDGDNEVLVAYDGAEVNAWNQSGGVLSGFPLTTGDGHILGQIAVANLDNQNDLEIVVGTRAPSAGALGRVFVFKANGNIMNGWPKSVAWLNQYGTEISEVRSVAVEDIDGDEDLEVIAATTNGAPRYSGSNPPATYNLYAWHANGATVAGNWPAWYGTAAIYGAVAVGDLTGNGQANIIAGRDHGLLYAYDGSGAILPGDWPVTTFVDGNSGQNNQDPRIVHANSAPVIADLDNDGAFEYIVVGNVKNPGQNAIANSGLLVLNADGSRKAGWETAALGNGILYDRFLPQKAPAIADLDGDNQLEIIVATYDGWIRAYNPDKSIDWAFNFAQGRIAFASEPVIGDIDGDYMPEIIFGTYNPDSGNGYTGLWGLEADGTFISNLRLPVEAIRAAPTLADFDKDGLLEILASTWHGKVYVWDTTAPYAPERLPWPTGRHDQRRTATYLNLKPDLDNSYKQASKSGADLNDTVMFTIHLQNEGYIPFEQTIHLTDTIPAGLSYVSNSLSAPFGVYTATGNILQWSGVMGNNRTVDISYEVTVASSATEALINTALINAGPDNTFTLSKALIINGWSNYLPFILKD